jgi:hypothetical protein
MPPLELVGAELVKVLVAPNTLVETLDVIEDFGSEFVQPARHPRHG